jgi:hypothetical protein
MPPDAAALAEVVVMTVQRAIAPLAARLAVVDTQYAALEPVTREVAALRERLAVVESREPIPGPAGKDGAPGADGLGFEDLSVDFDGERTLAFTFVRGDVRKSFPVALPFQRYQGTYQEGFAYVVGDVVTAGGNAWHCQQPTTIRPGESVNAWRLMVRKGRDGKDASAFAGAR